MKMKLTTPPATEPIELDDAKLYLRVDHDEEDDQIERMIKAAREYCEQYQRRVIGEQEWELYPAKAANYYELPYPVPIISIDDVTYLLEDGTTTETLTPVTDYRADCRSDTAPAELFIINPPTEKLDTYTPLTITVTAGYDDATERVLQAMYLLLGTFYEHRESFMAGTSGTEIPIGTRSAVHALLDPDRIMTF